MKYLIVFMASWGFVLCTAPVINDDFCSLPRTFSVVMSSLPSADSFPLVSSMSKISFNVDFESRCNAFLTSFLGDAKTTWQLASDRAMLDVEHRDRLIWAGIIVLKLLAVAGAFYFVYPMGENWRGWDALGLDLKAAYINDRMQQCFSIPITLFGLFAVYRVIASTLGINRYSKMIAGKIKKWLVSNANRVPQELADWYRSVSAYDATMLEKAINNGSFAQSLWVALCKNTLPILPLAGQSS